MKKRKWIHSKRQIHNTNRVLRLAKTVKRIFVVCGDRWNGEAGDGFAYFVKHGRIYNPDFDCRYYLDNWSPKKFPPEYEETLEELVEQGYNLSFGGYPGDRKKAYWNNHEHNKIDLIVQMRLMERW
ncbi:MAG: hypothetical protein ACI37O_04365 [Candidatus Avelusimicrobium sp.]|uniref:hypothetical protein n=1 Tax=Candidatus Avelusimicrobium sp. TaxID=3048833 RepID=UPI003F08D8BD